MKTRLLLLAAMAAASAVAIAESEPQHLPRTYFPRRVRREYTNMSITLTEVPAAAQTPKSSLSNTLSKPPITSISSASLSSDSRPSSSLQSSKDFPLTSMSSSRTEIRDTRSSFSLGPSSKKRQSDGENLTDSSHPSTQSIGSNPSLGVASSTLTSFIASSSASTLTANPPDTEGNARNQSSSPDIVASTTTNPSKGPSLGTSSASTFSSIAPDTEGNARNQSSPPDIVLSTTTDPSKGPSFGTSSASTFSSIASDTEGNARNQSLPPDIVLSTTTNPNKSSQSSAGILLAPTGVVMASSVLSSTNPTPSSSQPDLSSGFVLGLGSSTSSGVTPNAALTSSLSLSPSLELSSPSFSASSASSAPEKISGDVLPSARPVASSNSLSGILPQSAVLPSSGSGTLPQLPASTAPLVITAHPAINTSSSAIKDAADATGARIIIGLGSSSGNASSSSVSITSGFTGPVTLPSSGSASPPLIATSINLIGSLGITAPGIILGTAPPIAVPTTTPSSNPQTKPTAPANTSEAPVTSVVIIPISVASILPSSSESVPLRLTTSLTLPHVGVTSQTPTATFTQTAPWLPNTIIVAPMQSGYNGAAHAPSSSRPGGNTLPSGLPPSIAPAGANNTVPEGTTMIWIGLKYGYNYPFVVGNPQAAAQLFELLPQVLSRYEGFDTSLCVMPKLVPLDTRANLGYITTLAYITYPTDLMDALALNITNPNSALYMNQPEDILTQLANQINPAINITVGSSSSMTFVTPGSGSDSNSADSGNPLFNGDADINQNSKQKATTAGIVVGAAVVAGAYGAAMFVIARRYKRKKQAHRRASSLTASSGIMEASQRSPHFMGGALLSRDFSNYGAVFQGGPVDERHSHGSGSGQSGRTQYISAPMAAENSLGWN